MALYALILLLLLGRGLGWPTEIEINSTLDRRQCVRRKNSKDYDCDYQLPSLAQIVEHMRNPPDGKGVNAERPAVFYTNIQYPLPDFNKDNIDWIGVWLKQKGFSKGDDLRFYWYFDSWDLDCMAPSRHMKPVLRAINQEEHIDDYPDKFRAEYPDSYVKTFSSPGAVPEPDELFEVCVYHALGAAAVHPEAYLFAPKVLNPWSVASRWIETEYPALTQNPNIKTIYHVDPQPLKYKKAHPDPLAAVGPVQPPPHLRPDPKCGEEKLDEPSVLWSRARGDAPKQFTRACPVGTDIFPVK